MDLKLTVITRYVHLFGAPIFTVALGILLSVFLPDPSIFRSTYLAGLQPLVTGAHWLAFSALALGLAWFSWAGWQLYQWESGEMAGDCHTCGGIMSQLGSRYGPYRRCKYCGAKREGWG